MGARPYGIVRLDTASSPEARAKDPAGSQKLLAKTLKEAANIAADHGEKLALEGEICWDGCMFPNAVMEKSDTWNNILSAMINIGDAHGWR